MRGVEFAELAAFAAIAEQRSFSKAATQLGLTRSTLSQNLRALEGRLGVQLMNRTTRSVALTEAGTRLLERVRPALSELTSAVDQIRETRHDPAGLLRLVVQPPVATFLIGPLLGRFLASYPGVRLDVAVIKMPEDIVEGGFDAGIRVGEQIERDMIAIRVMEQPRFLVVASPQYLAGCAEDPARPAIPRLHSESAAQRDFFRLAVREKPKSGSGRGRWPPHRQRHRTLNSCSGRWNWSRLPAARLCRRPHQSWPPGAASTGVVAPPVRVLFVLFES
jgi:DNA-binding transcriptional LysR family regulator